MIAEKVAKCCGATVLHNFGHTSVTAELCDNPPTKDKIKDWIEKQEKFLINVQSMCLSIVFLNDEQITNIGDVFEECGYKVVSSGYNPKHRTIVHLLSKELIPVPEERKGLKKSEVEKYGKAEPHLGWNGVNGDIPVKELKSIIKEAGRSVDAYF